MMHFVFEAKSSETGWVASWSGEIPQSGVIVTESKTQEELRVSVKDAIVTFFNTSEDEQGFTFEILYI